jgi:hypothetical protein
MFSLTYLLAKELNPLNPPTFSNGWIWKANTTKKYKHFSGCALIIVL